MSVEDVHQPLQGVPVKDVAEYVPVEDVQPKFEARKGVKANPLREEHRVEEEVVKPSVTGIMAVPQRSFMPSAQGLSQKVLVLDMNGLLLRRYPYGQDLRDCCAGYDYDKVYKGGNDLGTQCLIRPDVLDFLFECGQMFQLCIWSSCYQTNINLTLRRCLKGMHPHIWKEQLSQRYCVKLPFKLSDVEKGCMTPNKNQFLQSDYSTCMKKDQSGLVLVLWWWTILYTKMC